MDWHDAETAKIDKNDEGLEAFANHSVKWREAGADIIGGCCRILPSHIAQMKKVHDKIDPAQLVIEEKNKEQVES